VNTQEALLHFLERREQFLRALARFEEAVGADRDSPFILDAAIQQFEFTFQMAWRVMRSAAILDGAEPGNPRQAMEHAFKMGLIADNGAWTSIKDDRNFSSHTYKEDKAEELYARLPGPLATFKAFASALSAWAPPSLSEI
jgi:nucleotidyltransferase substrate binding protein (TIGR01987 family)